MLLAQNIDFGGFITDALGNKIMGANIVAIEKETQVLDGFGISNEDGYFKLIPVSYTHLTLPTTPYV